MYAPYVATMDFMSLLTIGLVAHRSRYALVAAQSLATRMLEDRTNRCVTNGSPKVCRGAAKCGSLRPVGILCSSYGP
jgi:hypothetical protein